MNVLPLERRSQIIRALVEGNSVRATCRLTGAAKGTVLSLLAEVGEFCSIYQDHRLQNLPCTRIEADEIWAFVGAKQRNATRQGDGDIWTFTGICADTKLMVSWLVGGRNLENATAFMKDIASRLTNRIQLTTDGHHMYLTAVRQAFGYEVDFAQLVKTYGQLEEGRDSSRRYSPPVVTASEKVRVIGRPKPELISTSYVERQNLTMRMQLRRFTRLTNAHSKKAENHAHAVSLHFMHYNFCRAHATLTKEAGRKVTPAMAAGLTDRVWTVEDVLALMDPKNLLQSK
jgi:IS1 family transposase